MVSDQISHARGVTTLITPPCDLDRSVTGDIERHGALPAHYDALTPPERIDPMLLADALNAWMTFLKDFDGKTKSTRHDYGSHARAFAHWLGEHSTVADFTLFTLRAHIAEYARRCRPRSVRARLQSLRSFGNWCVSAGHLTENPANAVHPPQMDEPERHWPTDAKVSAVVMACERIADRRRAALTRAMLLTCVHTGLRSQELLDLTTGDLDLARGILFVRNGKGGKPRRLYPNEECLKALREWLRLRPGECTHPYLFALDRGRRVSRDSLRTIFRNVIAIAGFEPGDRDLTPHAFRRAYATRLLRHGANLDEIRMAMGHSSVYTTGLYLHTDEEQMIHLAQLSSLSAQEPAQQPAPTPPVPKRPAWTERRPHSFLKRTSLRR